MENIIYGYVTANPRLKIAKAAVRIVAKGETGIGRIVFLKGDYRTETQVMAGPMARKCAMEIAEV